MARHEPWPFVIARLCASRSSLTAALLAVVVRVDAPRRSRGRRPEAPMKPKHQRLVLVVRRARRAGCGGAAGDVGPARPGLLFLDAGRRRRGQGQPGTPCGSAEWSSSGSVQHLPDGVTIRFIVTDGKARDAGQLSRHRPRPVPRRQRRCRRRPACKAAPSSPTLSSPSMTSATCRPSSVTCTPSTRREDAGEMIAEAGLAALWLAAALAALQLC